MHIAILSRNKGLHSIRRLLQEASKLGIRCDIVNPLDCQLIVRGGGTGPGKGNSLLSGPVPLPGYDAVLPRIGASITDYGLAVVSQFESLGAYTVNSARSIAESRDKMRCLQVLSQEGIAVPRTVLTRNPRTLRHAVEAAGGFPVVLKVLKGTQGVGVMLLHTPIALGSVVDALRGLGQDVIIQQFLAEAAGRDYRAFVVGNRIVATMMRTAPEGEFRSNIHRGGVGKLIRLPRAHQRAAIRAAQVLGLEIAGVDLMDSKQGPMILEVNSSPGFEGIERATGLNIASEIMRHIQKRARGRSRRKRRRA